MLPAEYFQAQHAYLIGFVTGFFLAVTLILVINRKGRGQPL
jgi:hypothetical protein